MTPLILHRVRNGFLVAIHKGEQFIDLSEAFVAHSAAELIDHIEAHFGHHGAVTAQTPGAFMVPADSVMASLQEARSELDEPTVAAAPAAPAAQVQA